VSGSQIHHFACDRCRAKKVSRPREFYDLSITGNTMRTWFIIDFGGPVKMLRPQIWV
jgi:hypothetical protein